MAAAAEPTERLALIIAVESYQEADLPQAAHAEADAQALAQALERLGFKRENQLVLLGSQATRTAIASRLRKMLRQPPPADDALFAFYAGHAFREDGEDYLTCFDSQPDDLAETSIPLATLLEALGAVRCRRLALFLDPRGGLLPQQEPLSHEQLSAFAEGSPGAVCLVSCQQGETSHVSGSLKAGLWAHHLVEALSGKAPRVVDEASGQLTAEALQAHLEQELPRTARATFREAPAQRPCLYGPEEVGRLVLADLSEVLSEDRAVADPRLQPLKRGVLYNETRGKVKSLSGFRKGLRLPDRVNAFARKFVAELASEDVKQDIDQVYTSVRERIGYKRRDVESSADNNTGFVRTPDFEYSVSVDVADDDPTAVVWRREVGAIRNPGIVLGQPFQQVFGDVFDTLVFEFTRPFDLEAWVDRIEEEVPAGVKLRCASDCSTCDVSVAGFLGVIRLHHDRVEVQGRRTPGSRGLVEAFLHFQDLFATRRDLQALPLLEESRSR